MLQYLTIRDLAIIEHLELDWHSGFTCVTGETGAGKSILLGALNLLAGGRSDKSLIRSGASSCSVEAQLFFKDSALVDALLETYGLPLCDEGQLLIRRSVFKNKVARIHINGTLATRGALEVLGEHWIDFHGPGEHQQLLKESYQLTLIDLYADHGSLINAYQKSFRLWHELGEEIESLRLAEKLSPDEQDYLRHQIEAIDAVNPEDSVIEELEQTFNRVMHHRELIENASRLHDGILGDEGALSDLYELRQHADVLAGILSKAQELSSRFSSVMIELEDIASEYEALAQGDDFDEQALEQVQERMSAWLDLKRRYGEPAQLREKRIELAQKLESQGDIEGTLKRLDKERAVAEIQARKDAEALRESRQRAGLALCKRVNTLLKSLGFKTAGIAVEFVLAKTLHDYGLHKPAMSFAPNPGAPAQALSKIASSGEAARVMLAIKTALADKEATPVLVFDEVDANVGGEVGKAVGRALAQLGERHQVLCITHLPQVASLAKTHIRIVKESTSDKTQMRIDSLDTDKDARVDELARMLGDRNSKTAREHALELLDNF